MDENGELDGMLRLRHRRSGTKAVDVWKCETYGSCCLALMLDFNNANCVLNKHNAFTAFVPPFLWDWWLIDKG